jgi:hypothetical protein
MADSRCDDQFTLCAELVQPALAHSRPPKPSPSVETFPISAAGQQCGRRAKPDIPDILRSDDAQKTHMDKPTVQSNAGHIGAFLVLGREAADRAL